MKYEISLNQGNEVLGSGKTITANEVVETVDEKALAREIHHLNALIPEQVAESVLANFCQAAAQLMAMGYAVVLKNGNDAALRIYPDIHIKGNNINLARAKELDPTVTDEQAKLSAIARAIYQQYPTDGKYILANGRLIICQSHAKSDDLRRVYPTADINPLGDWTGGPDVDTGATNRKLGSDMADGVTGGGLHGKDITKPDVSVNIWCHLEAQRTGKTVQAFCAIGDTEVEVAYNGEPRRIPYADIVAAAGDYIRSVGGFEKFAEWGLV